MLIMYMCCPLVGCGSACAELRGLDVFGAFRASVAALGHITAEPC